VAGDVQKLREAAPEAAFSPRSLGWSTSRPSLPGNRPHRSEYVIGARFCTVGGKGLSQGIYSE
jgi:hypothetical protein